MILFSPAKINIGLRILRRRPDGFHDLQSLMYAVGLCDILEIRVEAEGESALRFSQTGIPIPSGEGPNLVERAWKLFSDRHPLPPLSIHLHKQIPIGAGLGGGSSNASTCLLGLNRLANEAMPKEQLLAMAAELGSDCPFFVQGGAMMMEGRGEKLREIPFSISEFQLVLLFPDIHISTAEAYAGVKAAMPESHLEEVLRAAPKEWKGRVVNDFEASLFPAHPILREIKDGLYNCGAVYAAMSGSGSAIYGLFDQSPDLPGELEAFKVWEGPASLPNISS
ncbi:MAG: 4-(cytidine 5'-diphospho)-2-C-methyl-D-erythritol kinase [Bacteroidetes bacterium]|nr:MAG: 4-(cytidine 5'-diphospho)-2-C-methyl-D-erythritol kinase [Bacteroidota bacterium]